MVPQLQWLESFCHSLSGATGSGCTYTIDSTVNPLIYKVELLFSESIPGSQVMNVWNMFQKFSYANDAVPHGKLQISNFNKKIIINVIVKRKSRIDKDNHPLG